MSEQIPTNASVLLNSLLHEFDWKSTSIADITSWSPYLKGSIGVCMNSRFANMVLAGPEMLAIYNDAYSKILESKHPAAFGLPISKVWPDLWHEISPMLLDVFNKGESFLYENRRFILNRKGYPEECFFNFSYSPIFNDTRRIEGILVSVTDNTLEVRNETLLRKRRNKQLKNLFVQAPIAMCILRGPKFIVEVANDKMLEIWGKPSTQMMDRPLFEALTDARDQGFEELLGNVYSSGKRVVFDEIPVDLLRNGKSEHIFVKLVYEALREEDGNVTGIMVVAYEITEQVNNRKTIEENEARLRLAIETTKLGTWDYIPRTGKLTWSDECRKIYDYPIELPVSFELFSTLLFPADKEFVEREISEALNPEGPGYYNIDFRVLRYTDKKVRWITATGKVFFDINKEADRFIGTVIDITDRKYLQDKLRESEMRTRLAVEASHMGTFDWDVPNSIFHYSDQLAIMFGYTQTSGLDQKSFSSRIHPDDQDMRMAAHQTAFETGTLFYEARVLLPDSTTRWVRLNGKVVYEDNGKPTRMYGTTLDITEHKRYAEQLEIEVAERTAKLEQQNRELEQFAYVASHDLQEPLRKIRTFSEIIQKNVTDGNVVTKYLNKLSSSAVRMSDMIKSVLDYSKLSHDKLQMAPVDLNHVLSDVVIDFELLITEKHAEIIYDTLPTIQCHRLQISQLFANLIGNSLKFSEENPVVTIKSRILSGSQLIVNEEPLPDKKFVELSFSDNGIGFEQKYEKLIFAIFQRLHGKQHFSGTGIGLALCKKIVENHDGYITAKGELEKGATFLVYLPIA